MAYLVSCSFKHLAVPQVDDSLPFLIIASDLNAVISPVTAEVDGERLVIRGVVQFSVAIEVDVADRLRMQAGQANPSLAIVGPV